MAYGDTVTSRTREGRIVFAQVQYVRVIGPRRFGVAVRMGCVVHWFDVRDDDIHVVLVHDERHCMCVIVGVEAEGQCTCHEC